MVRSSVTPTVQAILDAGPLGGVGFRVESKYVVPPTVVWLSRDASGRLVQLGPDKELLNLVAARSVNGLGWVPYRRTRDEPLRLGNGDVWRYAWDRLQDPAEQRAERRRGLRAVAG